MRLGVHGGTGHLADPLTGKRVKDGQRLNFIIKQFYADGFVLRFSRVYIDQLTTYPVGTTPQLGFITGILHVSQAPQNIPLVQTVAAVQMQHHLQVGPRVPQAIDRRNRRHDDTVRALQQGLGGRQSHLFDLLIDGGILLNIGIGGRHIGLRLIIVIVGNKVFHSILREQFPHLTVQLRRQGLVRCQHEGRTPRMLDNIGNGKGLARAGNPEQHLGGQALIQPPGQCPDGLRLVARRRVSQLYLEVCVHGIRAAGPPGSILPARGGVCNPRQPDRV